MYIVQVSIQILSKKLPLSIEKKRLYSVHEYDGKIGANLKIRSIIACEKSS